MENPAENEVETGDAVGWIWGLGFGSDLGFGVW